MNEENNATLPGQVCRFVVTDATALPAGAFKFVNSWGVGFSGEKVADDHYWVTYQTMKRQQFVVFYYYNTYTQAYRPTVVATFRLTHPRRDQAKVTLGLGPTANPVAAKTLQLMWGSTPLSGGQPFPANAIAMDISEFAPAINLNDLFLQAENSGASTGTIDAFAVEFYDNYARAPFKTIAGGTGAIAASGATVKTCATTGALTQMEQIAILPLPRSGSLGSVTLVEKTPSPDEQRKAKERLGVYEPGRNYNIIVNGMGTGFAPPSEADWAEMKTLVAASPENVAGGQPLAVDHSKSPYFPPIGNQGSKGSCTAFANAYYIHTFNEAKEHGWDLSTTTWGGGYPGQPSGNLDKIFSPDFVYHQVNSGVDSGSDHRAAATILIRHGCATWATMPYTLGDCTTWPSEAAWREAAKYRGASDLGAEYWGHAAGGYFVVDDDSDIDLLKTLLAAGHCVSTSIKSVNPGLYELLDAKDVVDDGPTAPMTTDHAQTIVGYKEGAAWDKANPDQ